jgi:hypothetical protein
MTMSDYRRDLLWPSRPSPPDMEALASAMTKAMFLGHGEAQEPAMLLERLGVCPRPLGDRNEPPAGYSVIRFTEDDGHDDEDAPGWGGWNVWGPNGMAVTGCIHDDCTQGFLNARISSRKLAEVAERRRRGTTRGAP